MRYRILLSVLLCVCLLWTDRLEAMGSCEPRLVGFNRLGPAKAVAISGDTAFLAAGYSLIVADVSAPAQPLFLSRLDLDFEVRALRIADSLLIAAGGSAGVVFFDISDLTSPAEVARVDTQGLAVDLTLVPGLALVADWFDGQTPGEGLLVFDISDPAEPLLAGSLPIDSAGAEAVAGFGTIAFVAGLGLHIIDVSDPAQPTEIATFFRAGWKMAVSESGRRLYTFEALAPPQDGYLLYVIDVSDPTAPFIVTSIPAYPDPFEGLVLGGGHLYTVDPQIGLLVYDIANEAGPPVLVGTLPSLRTTWDLALGKDLLLSSEGARGLDLLDVSQPPNPVEVGRFATPDETYGIAVAGDRAYLRTGSALRILDVSESAEPADLGSFPTDNHDDVNYGWTPTEFLLEGSLAYLPDSSGLRIVDVSDPVQPTEIGSWASERPGRSLTKLGDLLYFGTHSSSYLPSPALHVLDVTDPTLPVEVNALEEKGWWPRKLVANSDVLTGAAGQTCRLYDLLAPAAPVLAGSCYAGLSISDLALDENLLFISGIGLQVLDVSDPANPILVGSLPLQLPGARGVTLTGFRALLPRLEAGFLVVDVADPSAPLEAGSAETPGIAYQIAYEAGRIYVADGPAGLSIFHDCWVFVDGFESGDTSAWSSSFP